MAYHYQMFDSIFDIESINNLFIDSHYFVAQHRLEIFYLSNVKSAKSFGHRTKSGKSVVDVIRSRIYQTLPELRDDKSFRIIFYDLRNVNSLKRYFKLYGVATNATSALAYMNSKGLIFPPSKRDAVRHHGGNSLGIIHHARPVKIDDYDRDLASHADNRYLDVPKAYNVNFNYYPIKRTDPHYNPFRYGYGEMIGYNSASYDLVMVARLLGELIKNPVIRLVLNQDRSQWPTDIVKDERKHLTKTLDPLSIRKFNNQLFESKNRENMLQALIDHDDRPYFQRIETVPWFVYKGWKQTNRFLDISDFNRRVSLKRIEATMGMQIREASPEVETGKRGVDGIDELADFIADNVNDVYATRLTFELPVYQDALTLRKILLRKFPALIYSYDHGQVSRDQATPDNVKVAPDNLRFTRLNSDFSSAQFIINVIAPYHAMKDIPGLNYLYPDPRVLEILKRRHPNDPNVPNHPVNVLDDTMRWAQRQDRKYQTGGAIAKNFLHIFMIYLQIQYRNVNPDLCDSKTGRSRHFKLKDLDGVNRWVCPYVDIKSYLKPLNMNMPYIKSNGKPSSCNVTFSIGGIHGLEVNQHKFLDDVKKWEMMKRIQAQMKSAFGSDDTGAERLGPTFIIKKRGLIVSTRPYVKSNGHRVQWRQLQPPHLYRRLPHSKKYVLKRRYDYIAVDPCQHEDFSGYYPMLISRLGSFWPHDQSTDMYRHLYIERLHLKHQLRKYTKNSPKWDRINLQQKLRKLLLNAASGAGAGGFTNNLRMNNAIISMRIIGQLFAWRIGEAETLAGGRVPSTNTDGMYVMDVSQKTNNQVLFKNVKAMMLDIVPSPLARFVSKDANNRVEVERHHGRNVLTEAKGSTLRSWQGPSPSNHLSHPAIADWVLAHYLAYYHGNPSNHPFDRHLAMRYLNEVHAKLLSKQEFVWALKMFQWINISNRSKHRYLFLQRERWDPVSFRWQLVGFNPLPKTNRIFMVKNNLRGVNHFIKIATNQKNNGNQFHRSDPYSIDVLAGHYYRLKPDEYGKVIKVTDMPDNQNVYLNSHRLKYFTIRARRWLYNHLDINAYLKFIEMKFNSSWFNK